MCSGQGATSSQHEERFDAPKAEGVKGINFKAVSERMDELRREQQSTLLNYRGALAQKRHNRVEEDSNEEEGEGVIVLHQKAMLAQTR